MCTKYNIDFTLEVIQILVDALLVSFHIYIKFLNVVFVW